MRANQINEYQLLPQEQYSRLKRITHRRGNKKQYVIYDNEVWIIDTQNCLSL